MDQKEAVLCIKRNNLPKTWVKQISIVPMDLTDFINKSTAAGFEFIPRSQAETDDSKKQIIPYIILQTHNLKRTAIYNRQGSEQRLHDLWSIGIGGHINPEDNHQQTDSFEKILMAGMKRELDEELEHRPQNDTLDFLGVISEEKTDVGKVHLGAVFRILTDTPDKYSPGSELFQFKWEDTSSLEDLNLELWSRLTLKLVPDF
ncbi:MAG: phosphoesterase [Desulfobacula sp.]|nr:phosphoesterase [Desulfobacula sp.]